MAEYSEQDLQYAAQFRGEIHREALAAAGLFIRSDSTILADADTVRVAFQSPSPGSAVSLGTVVEVTLVNEDDQVYGIY